MDVALTPSKLDSIGVIELELLKLVRHLETFGRRSSLYLEVDRAGYLALRMLEAMGPVSTKALAAALNLDASTVTRQISALERAAFVERRPDPLDGRSSTIILTEEGRHTMSGVEAGASASHGGAGERLDRPRQAHARSRVEQIEYLSPRKRESGQGRGLNTGYGRSV